MRALVFTRVEKNELREEAEPQPAPDETVIDIEASGICGSDLHGWLGHDPRRVPPLVLGHEACGIAGSGRFKGQRVAINPLVTCGRCRDCTSGRRNLCPDRQLLGIRRPGTFAERVAAPEANLIPVPEGLDSVRAAVTEPCAVAWHAVRRAGRLSAIPLAESRTLVLSGGAIGLLCALVLRAWGALDVLVSETHPGRRKTVRNAGFEVLDPASQPAGAAKCELVIDAVGSAATRTVAIRSTQRGGTIIHVGLHDPAGDFDARTLTLDEVTFAGTYCYSASDFAAALEAIGSGRLGDLGWVEPRPLADGIRAFEDLHAGRVDTAKIVLVV